MTNHDYIMHAVSMKKNENNIILSDHCVEDTIKRIFKGNNPMQKIATLFRKATIKNFVFQNYNGKKRMVFIKNNIYLIFAIDELLANKIFIITVLNGNRHSLGGRIKKGGKHAKAKFKN